MAILFVEEYEHDHGQPAWRIIEADNSIIANDVTTKEMAELIVRAVNAYDDLQDFALNLMRRIYWVEGRDEIQRDWDAFEYEAFTGRKFIE